LERGIRSGYHRNCLIPRSAGAGLNVVKRTGCGSGGSGPVGRGKGRSRRWPGGGVVRWWPAVGSFFGVVAGLVLVLVLAARLLVLQVPVATAPAVDFEFGPLEPGSLTTQGLGDLAEAVSGIALPVVAYESEEAGVGVLFRILAGDGTVVEEAVLDLRESAQAERTEKAGIPGVTMRSVRFTFEPLRAPVHGATLEIEAVDLGDAQVFLGATKDDALPAGRLTYQGTELFEDQDLRVGQLRKVMVWRLLAELRQTSPTGFAAAVAMGGVAVLLAGVAVASRLRPGT